MSDELRQLLDSLTFEPEPLETIYLNPPRVHEQFIMQLGAVESLVRASTTDQVAGSDVMIFKGQVGRRRENEIKWKLDDPFVQALVLRASLEREGRIRGRLEARVGDFVSVTGTGY